MLMSLREIVELRNFFWRDKNQENSYLRRYHGEKIGLRGKGMRKFKCWQLMIFRPLLWRQVDQLKCWITLMLKLMNLSINALNEPEYWKNFQLQYNRSIQMAP